MKRFSLSRDERISGKKNFTRVFEHGLTIYSNDKKIKAIYLKFLNQGDEPLIPGVQIAAAISRKNGNAVWRNRIRRLIKESYRLEKLALSGRCTEGNIPMHIIFLPVGFSKKRNPVIKLADIRPPVANILNQILAKL